MKLRAIVVGLIAGLAVVSLSASGPVGFYGIIDKVVFEPNEQAPERVQVWGAFAYVDGAKGTSISAAKRGTGPASEVLFNPAPYITNFGVVKLADVSHGAVIRALREAR